MTQADGRFSIATWNINSVRLRRGIVEDFLQRWQPDILCLQEIKCEVDSFPGSGFADLGYQHIAIRGQKAYHGVATLSRHPIVAEDNLSFCAKNDARHLRTVVDVDGYRIALHNFYVPAGGDVPDPQINDKFAHKLAFLEEMNAVTSGAPDADASLLVGDLNVAPLENDVWSHKQMLKVVSHTPVETTALESARAAGGWLDLMRQHVPADEKLFTWWSYRARDWAESNRGRRLDHVWSSSNLGPALADVEVVRDARGWEKPSDHVPVIARFSLPAKL